MVASIPVKTLFVNSFFSICSYFLKITQPDLIFFCLIPPFFVDYVFFGLLERYSELGRKKIFAIYKISAKNGHAMLVLWPETSNLFFFDDFRSLIFFSSLKSEQDKFKLIKAINKWSNNVFKKHDKTVKIQLNLLEFILIH